MPIGPVQLFVLGFDQPDSGGEIVEALRRLGEDGSVRVIDSLAVYKDAAGQIAVQPLAGRADPAEAGLGLVIGALVGLAVEGDHGLELDGAAAGSDGIDPLAQAEGWDVLQDIPDDTAAALVLIEHRWAVPLRDAMVRVGAFRISDGFISPFDLAAIGLVSPGEAERLHAIETGGGDE